MAATHVAKDAGGLLAHCPVAKRRSLSGGAAPPWLRRSVPSRAKSGARGAVVIIMINAVPNNDGSEATPATGGGELPAFGDIWAPGAGARMCAPSCHPAVAALGLPRYASAEKAFWEAPGEPIHPPPPPTTHPTTTPHHPPNHLAKPTIEEVIATEEAADAGDVASVPKVPPLDAPTYAAVVGWWLGGGGGWWLGGGGGGWWWVVVGWVVVVGGGWWLWVVSVGCGRGWWWWVVAVGGGGGWWWWVVVVGGGGGWWWWVVVVGGGGGWWWWVVVVGGGA